MEIKRFVIEIDKSTGKEILKELDLVGAEEKDKLMQAVLDQGMIRAGFERLPENKRK